MFIYHPHFSNNKVFCGTTVKKESGSFALHTAENDSERKTALDNRQRLLKDTAFQHLITLQQTHSDTIHIINHNNIPSYSSNPLIEGDALLTDQRNVLLGVLTADCVPIFYTDRDVSFCGIAHAGWKGLKQGIHLKMVKKINDTYGIPAAQIQVIVGPHIRKCCYEIKKDFIEQMGTDYYDERQTAYYLDMASLIRSSLVQEGIPKQSVFTHTACTKCSKFPRLYSYRNGNQKERALSFIGMKGITAA